MIDWHEIEGMPRDLAAGSSFLFCTLSKHIFHVTLVVRNDDALCWSIEGPDANGKLMLDQDMALVTHYANYNLPEATQKQIAAAAVRVANLDGRYLAYEHDRYGR
ncbi:hypothetical protein [Sphingomonas sp. PR090111-T3T-6A]|uniref:hypothetical protein n=1 Tax=Sphingomonas sp. PR090111-T3T-6A TaxID=685778 RepID=UPI00037C1EE3|nr:hypothetical protein [Sphingomonas sp. PR090111-T3T-6A]